MTAKTKHTKDLLSEQPLYKQSKRKPLSKKLTNQQLLQVLPFHHGVDI